MGLGRKQIQNVVAVGVKVLLGHIWDRNLGRMPPSYFCLLWSQERGTVNWRISEQYRDIRQKRPANFQNLLLSLELSSLTKVPQNPGNHLQAMTPRVDRHSSPRFPLHS